MKIAVLWTFDKAKWVFPNWRDGLKAAFEIIAKTHEVEWILGDDCLTADLNKYDAVVQWDNSSSTFAERLREFDKPKKGLILTTELGLNLGNLRAYDVVFCEATTVQDLIKPHGIRTQFAFGTDTDFFNPIWDVHHIPDKEYEAFYPSTFSQWKRQNIFASKWGDKGLCLGTVQPDGWDILRETINRKTNVFIGYLPVEKVREFYSQSKSVDITGWEGSGRTVIEALSMDLPVTVSEDNHKCQSYIKELEESGMSPRAFAIKYYSEQSYADAILKGLQ